MEKVYIHNDCDVVINPTVLFHTKHPKAMAWCYFSIKIGKCINGLWDYGYTVAGGGSPVCLGQYENKDIAKEKAIQFLEEYFKKGFKGQGMYNEVYFKEAKIKFNIWVNKMFLSKESQTNHLVHIPDNGYNYSQTSLF